jgi:hypothetical protein
MLYNAGLTAIPSRWGMENTGPIVLPLQRVLLGLPIILPVCPDENDVLAILAPMPGQWKLVHHLMLVCASEQRV